MPFINEIIEIEYPICAESILNSPIIKYLTIKTKSLNKGSKSRSSFGNLYAIYVLVEDYLNYINYSKLDYSKYDGMKFTDAFYRQRQLPFGGKLQNHALNHRCNQEFLKYFPNYPYGVPIIRDKQSKRYWINEKLLLVECNDSEINIAGLVLKIINRYIELKRQGFELFFHELQELNSKQNHEKIFDFIRKQLNPEVDARIFEIISFAIIKYHYFDEMLFIGNKSDSIKQTRLKLFRTGRTNSNDGGIDFILIPLGRIFQVTEVLDFKKYFLDIDKVNKYPVSFVIKTTLNPDEVKNKIENAAKHLYKEEKVRNKYLSSFDEIITIPILEDYLINEVENNYSQCLVDEIILQCKVEFNIETI